MQRKKVIVTGGAGFIGSHVAVSLFEAFYEPILVDNFCNAEYRMIDGIQAITGEAPVLHEGNCCDKDFLKKVFQKEGPIFGAIHFAAYKAVGESVEKPLKYYHNNISSLVTLMDVMLSAGCQNLIFSSSATVYGDIKELPVTESNPRKTAQSPYGNTKKICEEIIEDVYKSGVSLKSIALRYFNPIGAHPSAHIGELPLGLPNNLIPFITQTAAGISEQLTVFGDDYNTFDGTCIRDYINVMDLAEVHVATLNYLKETEQEKYFDVLNVGTGSGHSVMEVIKAFENVNDVKLSIRIGNRRAGDIESLYADVKKCEQKLGWKATRSLEDSLRSAWNWQLTLASKGKQNH